MHIRPAVQKIVGGAALAAVGAAMSVGSVAAAPPLVDAFDVAFVDSSCGDGLDAEAQLHVQFTDKLLPDGSVHHWLDLSGTLTNPDNGRFVTLHAARRFTDSPTGDSSTFRGLQGQFAAPGVGPLVHNSGWSDDVISLGRWDMTPTNELAPSVCDYLFG